MATNSMTPHLSRLSTGTVLSSGTAKTKQMYSSYLNNIRNNFTSHSQSVSILILVCIVFICVTRFYSFKKMYIHIGEMVSMVVVLYNIWLQFVVSKDGGGNDQD